MTADPKHDVVRIASALYDRGPDWVTFFREVLGLDGLVHKAFQDLDERTQFEKTDEYQQIQQMLATLRQRETDGAAAAIEPIRVITVRLPKSVHEALKAEADTLRTSMNKLCISKLLQVVDNELIPTETVSVPPTKSRSASRSASTAGTP